MLYIVITILLVNLAYWLLIFSSFSYSENKSHSEKKTTDSPQVTVCLTIKNEAKNIEQHFETILKQNYPAFKVLVVDDNSTDKSIHLLERYKLKYPYLKIRKNIKNQGKKLALHKAIGDIETEYLLFTDGDCRSISDEWIKLMMGSFTESVHIILAYGPFFKQEGLLNKFVRFEGFMTALQYFSYALRGIPYMGVGRNIAYKKSLFKEAGGFSSHLNLASGDDDLFINQVSNAKNVAIQIHPDSFIYSEAKSSLKSYIKQKRRHISTSVKYKLKHQLLLSAFAISHILFYIGLFIISWKIAVFLWVLRMVLIMIFNYKSFYKLKEQDLLVYFPLLDIFMFAYYSFMSVSMLFPKNKKW